MSKIILAILALIALSGAIYYVYPSVTRPDAMTLFFECTDDMDAHHVDALQAMSFCGGILKEEP